MSTKIEKKSETVARSLAPNVRALLLAKAHEAATREKIEPEKRASLDHCGYQHVELRHAWTIPDEDFKRYVDRLHAVYTRMGYELEHGVCPLLQAESLTIEAENALIEAAEQHFPGVTNHRLLCGVEGRPGLELRRDYIDKLCGLVLKHPAGLVFHGNRSTS
jgi:hypothetical protein